MSILKRVVFNRVPGGPANNTVQCICPLYVCVFFNIVAMNLKHDRSTTPVGTMKPRTIITRTSLSMDLVYTYRGNGRLR